MAIETVDFPIKNGDFPSFVVCLPGRVFLEPRIFSGQGAHSKVAAVEKGIRTDSGALP